jgi:NADH-quinone oxidoreductase subunit G
VLGKITASFRCVGFDEVHNMSVGGDFISMDESKEFLEGLRDGKEQQMLLFTSYCPAWVRFAENGFPDVIPDMSTCHSRIQIRAETLKNTQVAVAPCAKKIDVSHDEFVGKDGLHDVHSALASTDIIRTIQETGIDLKAREPERVDTPCELYSGVVVILRPRFGGRTAARQQ